MRRARSKTMNIDIDPITLVVIQNGLNQVCNEMDLAFCRAAFSPVISEAMDRSDGIYHRDDGALIAQGELGLPVFVGTMQFSTQAVIARAKSVEPGDVFIVNDPYLGGTHLMDVRFVKPFFYQGKLFAWLANTGHWPDIGGMVPGGFSAHATESEQEGLRLPPVKLFKRGVMDEEILAIILSNIRIADQRIGDIKAQAAALAIGEKRLAALLDRYGADTVDARDRGTARARRAADARQDRHHPGRRSTRGHAIVDSDGVVDEPLLIKMKITKQGTGLTFDMSGSSPPCRGPMNSVIATTKSSIYLAMKHIFPDVPINAGTFEPLDHHRARRHLPLRALPAPGFGLRGGGEPAHRRSRVLRPHPCDSGPVVRRARGLFGQPGARRARSEAQRSYVMYVISGGGYGGNPRGDGLSNGCSTIGISKTTPIEVMEQYYPVLFEEYSLHEGSGGAGEHRGGFGVNYTISPAPRRCARLHGDGPWPHRPAGRAGRRRRRREQGAHRARRRELRAAASVQGPGHRDAARRPHLRLHARRRRLRRSVQARPAARGAGRGPRLLHDAPRPGRCSALQSPTTARPTARAPPPCARNNCNQPQR